MSSKQSNKCVFCTFSLFEKQIIHQTKDSFLILDLFPNCKYHLLAIPKKHISNILEISDSEFLDLKNILKIGENILSEKVGINNFNLVINQGKKAGQEIFHLHWHLLPRTENETKNPLKTESKELRMLSKEEIEEQVKFLS